MMTRYGHTMPTQSGWYVDTGTGCGTGGVGLIGPFATEFAARMESIKATAYHREYGIREEKHERFFVTAAEAAT